MKRAFDIVAAVAVVWALLVFFYGAFEFPDAPYKACDVEQGYCGKNGRSHSEAEFRAARTWEHVLMVSWALGIASAIYLARRKR